MDMIEWVVIAAFGRDGTATVWGCCRETSLPASFHPNVTHCSSPPQLSLATASSTHYCNCFFDSLLQLRPTTSSLTHYCNFAPRLHLHLVTATSSRLCNFFSPLHLVSLHMAIVPTLLQPRTSNLELGVELIEYRSMIPASHLRLRLSSTPRQPPSTSYTTRHTSRETHNDDIQL